MAKKGKGKKKAKKRSTIAGARAKLKLSKKLGKIARAPLKKKGTGDAWNERQNRLAASRDSAKLLVQGTQELNRAKRRKKKK